MFLAAIGAIWTLQGLGLLDWPPGSVMLAQGEWAVYGLVAMLTGIAAIWRGHR